MMNLIKGGVLLCSLSAMSSYAGVDSNYSKTLLDGRADKPAFVKITDLDGDDTSEIIVSMFGGSPMTSGSVYIYKQVAGEWTKSKLPGSNTRFPNSITVEDINGDGLKDIILPSGFLACTSFPFGYCGGMQWYAQNPDNTFTVKTLLKKKKRFYHHVEFVDFDHDGKKDLVAVGEEKGLRGEGSSELHVFRGNDSDRMFETKPTVITDGLGSYPRVIDMDQDGDWEVFSSEYFGSKGSFSWINQDEKGKWQKHYIDADVGKSIQISFVRGLFGKDELWAIGSNHTNTTDDSDAPESAIYLYKVPNFNSSAFNPAAAWDKKKISEGIVSVKSPMVGVQGAPGVFAYGDVDGDGDIDIVVSGDGDPRYFVLEQGSDGEFRTIVLDTDVPQGGIDVADLDGDGVAEIVASSYENKEVYIYKYKK